MVRLQDKETGAPVGEITEEQLRFLIEELEEESLTDQDYYINRATLDMFEDDGADPQLLDVLRRALGGREEMEIRWTKE